MFEVKNSIDWKTAKSYFNDKDNESEIFYDRKDYSRFLVFTPDDSVIPIALDALFGGDWRYLWPHDYTMLDTHYEALNRIDVLADLLPKSDLVLTTFPEHLRMFLSEFSDLLNVKNKAYGNSALEPINVFSKASSADVILQQIDHKLSRLKTSDTPSKNDVIDLMGYLTLYCLDQSWLDLQDLHK